MTRSRTTDQTRNHMTNRMTDHTSYRTTNRHAPNFTPRSTEMYALHEALAREHLRQLHEQSRRDALSSELAAANRWRYLEARAHAAFRRHSSRAARAAQVLAVAD